MAEPTDKLTREERLAAKLRENLHRRKAQARAVNATASTESADIDKNESAALPKRPSES